MHHIMKVNRLQMQTETICKEKNKNDCPICPMNDRCGFLIILFLLVIYTS